MSEPSFLSSYDPLTIQEAEYAVNALAKLSDSRIYSSLSLFQILEASEEDGIFHHNTMMKIELASDFFKSGEATEVFDFVVMTHKDDGVKSFAIDEFPVMDENAIETFWIDKVQERRSQKERTFRELQLDAVRLQQETSERASIDARRDSAVELVLNSLDSPELLEARIKASASVQRNLAEEAFVRDEEVLSRFTLAELYRVSMGLSLDGYESEFTDYQKERATFILDVFFSELDQKQNN